MFILKLSGIQNILYIFLKAMNQIIPDGKEILGIKCENKRTIKKLSNFREHLLLCRTSCGENF